MKTEESDEQRLARVCAELKECIVRLFYKDRYINELQRENQQLKDQLADLALKKRKGKRKR